MLALGGTYATLLYAHYKAQRLLKEVRAIEPGKTDIQDIRKLMTRYGGQEFDAHSYIAGESKRYASADPCLGESMSYSIGAAPPIIILEWIGVSPRLQRLGLHPWSLALNIDQKDGKVSCLSQITWYSRPDGHWLEAEALLRRKNPDLLEPEQTYEAKSFVSRGFYHGTRVKLLLEASKEQKERAFQMDLSCTMSFRGCYFPCQLIPFAWLDSARDQRSRGWDLPEGANDPRCPAL